MHGVSSCFLDQAQELYGRLKEWQGFRLAKGVLQEIVSGIRTRKIPQTCLVTQIVVMIENISTYLCAPVTVGRLGKAVSRPYFDLATVVDAEINVSIEDRVAYGVQTTRGTAETEEVVSRAELHDPNHHLLRI